MAFLQEFWRYIRARRKYWLLPILIVMVILGGLVVFVQGSAIGPLLYTIY